MTKASAFAPAAVLVFSTVLSVVTATDENRRDGGSPSASGVRNSRIQRPATEVGHPTFVSPHASPIAISGEHVFVVNTPSDTVDVIDRRTRKIVSRVNVGIAVRPDGKEVWVSNHVSDSVSVIDSNPKSPTFLQVIATIQEFDRKTKATRFDEPVGIAFAGNDKAYVALSACPCKV